MYEYLVHILQVCGSADIDVATLKAIAVYKGFDPHEPLVKWFWEVLEEEFSAADRSLFLRFVWGRARLPRALADFKGRDFVLQALDKVSPYVADHFLPEAYTWYSYIVYSYSRNRRLLPVRAPPVNYYSITSMISCFSILLVHAASSC